MKAPDSTIDLIVEGRPPSRNCSQVARINITMDDYTFLAGQSLRPEGTDSYGNAVDVSAAQVLANDAKFLITKQQRENPGEHVWHRYRPARSPVFESH